MQKAIRRYIKQRSDYLKDINLNKNNINQAFETIEHEIDIVRKAEIKRARGEKLREWRKREKLNYRHNNKKSRRLRR